MEDKICTMPAVALRGMTILPGMVAHFDISRERSIKAVETAMMGDQTIFLVTPFRSVFRWCRGEYPTGDQITE